MATRLLPPGYQEFDASGAIAAGAKLYTYSAGTSTPKATYSDAALTVANANPVVADGSGRFGDIFAGVGSYRLVMQKSDGSTLWTADPVDGASSSGSSGSSASGNLIVNGDFNLNTTLASSVGDAAASFDGWSSLVQTGNVTVAQQTDAENGQPTNIRITQAQAVSQRFGHIQWIASKDSRWLRGSDVATSGRVRVSVQTKINYALVEWQGTADSPTVDIVNDWNNSTLTPGNFFIAGTLAVVITGSVTPTANTWTDLTSITGVASSSLNNLYWFVWTDAAQVQNVTLDVGIVRVGQGTTAPAFERAKVVQQRVNATLPRQPDAENTADNILINGDYQIWQRGTSVAIPAASTTTATVYAADQWCMETSAAQACTISRQADGTNAAFRARVQRDSGQTGTSVLRFQQPLETFDVQRLRGGPVTVSFRAAAGANLSGTLAVKLLVGTGTEGRRTNAAAYTGETSPLSQALTLTTTTTGFTATSAAIVPTNATQGALVFEWTPAGTAGANDWFEVVDVKLQIGTVATPFARRSLQETWDRCQRFYQITEAAISVEAYAEVATRKGYQTYVMPVRMRATPTVSGTFTATTACTPSVVNVSAAHFQIQISASGATAMSSTYSSGNTIDARL